MQTTPSTKCTTLTSHFLLTSVRPLIEREAKRLERNLDRAQRKDLPATLTLWEWLTIIARYNWSCAFCRGPFETMEHLTRLADGGGTTAENVAPCCVACNQLRGKLADQAVTIAHVNLKLVS